MQFSRKYFPTSWEKPEEIIPYLPQLQILLFTRYLQRKKLPATKQILNGSIKSLFLLGGEYGVGVSSFF
jgi:hypothetical protein